MRVPLFRLQIGPRTEQLLFEAFHSGKWSNTAIEYAPKLEAWWAAQCQAPFALSTNSGTAAVRAALFGVAGRRGGTALTTTYSCSANLTPLHEMGLSPVWCDVDLQSFGMTGESVFQRLSEGPTPECCVLVHMYGQLARDTEDIVGLCREKGVVVIHDLSECVGMDVAGLDGDVFIASVRTEKMLGAGEGGLVAFRNFDHYRAAKTFVWRGKPSTLNYWVTSYGDNVAMTNLTAAIALGQIDVLHEQVAGKRLTASLYRSSRLEQFGDFQTVAAGDVAWLNALLLKPDIGLAPQDLAKALAAKGIETRPAFTPLPIVHRLQTVGEGVAGCPAAREIFERCLILPSPADLTAEELEYVVVSIEEVMGR